MKRSKLAFIVLLLCPPALAAGGPDELLLREVYPQGGHTLYCNTVFEPGDRLAVDTIYPLQPLLHHFGCTTLRQCLRKQPFLDVYQDLHNYYPVTRASSLTRRGALFDDLPDDLAPGDCGIRTSFQSFQPPAHARGNVARAVLYMHRTHGLPLHGTLEMYRRWHREDPPDDAERLRNDRIGRLQQRRNPFIDRPELVDRLEP